MIRDARCHCRRDAERLMNAAEVAEYHVERDGVRMILDLL